MTSFMKPEETNWNRACRLLTEAGKEVLMLYLHDVWSRSRAGYVSLDDFLAQNRSTLNKVAAKGFLQQTQMDILYPASGFTDTGEWDITLVSCVIYNCIPNRTVLQKAAIKTIRDLRNKLYGHDGKMKMNDKEFTQNWAKIQQGLTVAARDLCVGQHFSLQVKKDRIEKEQIVDCEELRNTIQAWKSCDIVLSEDIQLLGEENKKIMSMMTEERRDTKGMRNLLEERTSHDRDMERNMTEERREIAHDMKTVLSEVRGMKTLMTFDNPRPVNKFEDSGRDSASFSGRARCYLRRLVGLVWTLVAYFWLLLGYRPIEQPDRTAAGSGPEAETALPEEFRVLQSGLMDYYKSLLTLPTGVGSLSEQADIDEIYAKPRLVRVDHTAGSKEKAKENEKSMSLNDIFLDNTSASRQIYVSGDAGKGKTSLCKRIIKEWCSVHSQGQLTDDPGQLSTLKQFHFLFYISLRNACEEYDINEMIVSQLLYKNHHIKQASNDNAGEYLDNVLELYSEMCLVVLDGLDEWVARRNSRYPSVSNGIPGRNPFLKYTILTTTRPWKLESLRLKNTEIDCQLEVKGVESIYDFGQRLVCAHNKMENKQKQYRDFEVKLYRAGLQKMKETPILLKQLICLWHDDQPFGKSKTGVYTHMVELLFKLAEKRKDVTEFDLQKTPSEVEAEESPIWFKNMERCERYKCLILSVGKLAFETMFCSNKETQLVFESSEARKNGLYESDLDVCLNVGILTQNIIPDKTWEKKSLSFLHKTFHEYFAALYLSVFGKGVSDIKTRFGSKCKSLDSVFDVEDMFLFLSGMCPSLMEDVSTCLVTAINNDTKVEEARLQQDHESFLNPLCSVQSMILACCKESSDNGLGSLYIPVPDVVMRSLSHESCRTLGLCVQKYPSELRSFQWERGTSISDIEEIISVKHLDGACLEGSESDTYYMDFSIYKNLSHLVCNRSPLMTGISHMCYLSWKVIEQQLVSLHLSHVSSQLVLSTIRQATHLKTLILHSVQCSKSAADAQDTFSLDLAGHNDLAYVWIKHIPAGRVTLNSSIGVIKVEQIHTLSHDGMCSLMSSISNAHSLEYITLDSVKCRDHITGEGCQYEIDLSGHSGLRTLYVEDISPESVTLGPSIKRITMRNVHTLSRDGMCSLMASISNAHSLEDITLDCVKCGDHITGEGCQYEIDLSGHSGLRMLDVADISPESVTLSPSIWVITVRNIHTLSYDGMCSLMSSISNAHSLEYITLDSVKCGDHITGEGCQYEIDLSGQSGLRRLNVKDMPLGSVTLSPDISWITVRNSHTLSHDGMCSLMSSISNAHSLEDIILDSVKCGDHITGEGCQYEIDLSGHSGLRKLDVADISPESVTLGPSIKKITMRNVHTLSHDGMCSLMSSISNAHSLEDITLDSVKCGDHITREGCQYEIDLSGHSGLRQLDVADISPESVTLSPDIRKITVRNILTLSHDGMCSLMSSISNAPSLIIITLDSVKCGDHITGEGCQYEIDLSGHSGLRKLDVADISPESVTLGPSIKRITMRNVHTLSHDSMCSLMSSISNAHSLTDITLDSVKCGDHITGEGCQYEIDLSGHSGLRELDVAEISPESVTLSPSISRITVRNSHTLSHDGMCSLMSSISNAHSLEYITLDSVKCGDHITGEGCQYKIDLSGNGELRMLNVKDMSLGTVTLSPDISQITVRNSHTLSHDGMCSLMSSISNAHSLKDIILYSVKCRDHITGEGCQCEIDLSGHSGLRELDVAEISPEYVTLSPAISVITMRNIHTLSHDGMCSLMSSISNAHSLVYIILDSVKCGDHITGEGCQYEIDLSAHSGLRELDVAEISPESVTLSPSISGITMRNILTLSHDGMFSLMSSISNAHSLVYIILVSVKCGDHVTGEGCQYVIDLSALSRLERLYVEDISLESVTLSPAISVITMRNIHTLSHDGMCSLMSSISNAHSLVYIILDSVKCGDHITGEGCQYEIDLSAHSGLRELDVAEISPESVTLSPSISGITMRNILTLSHDGMFSLMSSISNAHSLVYIILVSVKCGDHVTGEGCQYVIDLSALSRLERLYVEDISLESVTLSPAISVITMRNIHTLSHDGMCSLMSSISNAHSLVYIILDSVKCGDHITGEGCQYEIDLSAHSGLRMLDVKYISPKSVTLGPSIKLITMRNIHTLSHGGMCSLMSSISSIHSLEGITLVSVKCGDHITGEGCQYVIDLSGHTELETLYVRDISPESVTLSPSIRRIVMTNIHTLSHDSMCSLMSSISNIPPHSGTITYLKSIRCKDYVSGDQCGKEIELETNL